MSEQPPTDPNQPAPPVPPGPPGYPPPPGYPAPPGYPPQVYGQPPYGAPQYGQPSYGPVKTNGMAVASLVLGILWIYWIGSILALIFGYLARNQIKARGETGDGMAVAGIVLGWIGVGVLLLGLVFGLAFSASFHG